MVLRNEEERYLFIKKPEKTAQQVETDVGGKVAVGASANLVPHPATLHLSVHPLHVQTALLRPRLESHSSLIMYCVLNFI